MGHIRILFALGGWGRCGLVITDNWADVAGVSWGQGGMGWSLTISGMAPMGQLWTHSGLDSPMSQKFDTSDLDDNRYICVHVKKVTFHQNRMEEQDSLFRKQLCVLK